VLRIGPRCSPARRTGSSSAWRSSRHAARSACARCTRSSSASAAEGLERASITQILQALVDRGETVTAVDVHKGWMEVDSFEDYRRAWAEMK
jgi:hypothetical protein